MLNQANATNNTQKSMTDTAYFYDVGTLSNNFGSHTLNNFTGHTVLNASATISIDAIEFDVTSTILYGIANNAAIGPRLLILNQNNGSIDSVVGPITNLLPNHSLSGLAIDSNGTCYISSIGPSESTLYICDLATGMLSIIGSQETAIEIIAIAASCEGTIYAHDTFTDGFYNLDTSNGSATLIGTHGLNAINSPQGMTYDREAGVLYSYIYSGAGNNVFATVNTSNGEITPLAVNNPTGQFIGAAKTSCFPAIPPQVVSINSYWMLLVMIILFLLFVYRNTSFIKEGKGLQKLKAL